MENPGVEKGWVKDLIEHPEKLAKLSPEARKIAEGYINIVKATTAPAVVSRRVGKMRERRAKLLEELSKIG